MERWLLRVAKIAFWATLISFVSVIIFAFTTVAGLNNTLLQPGIYNSIAYGIIFVRLLAALIAVLFTGVAVLLFLFDLIWNRHINKRGLVYVTLPIALILICSAINVFQQPTGLEFFALLKTELFWLMRFYGLPGSLFWEPLPYGII